MTWSSTDRFDLACTAVVLVIGLVTCLAVRRRLGRATLPVAGLFVLAADSKLFWPSFWALNVLEQLGYTRALFNRGPWLAVWYYGWHFLPVLLAAFFAWALWRALRSPSQPNGPRSRHPAPGH